MIKGYFLFDKDTNKVEQFVLCKDTEIVHYGSSYIETEEKDFSFDFNKDYYIKDGVLVETEKTDNDYLIIQVIKEYEDAVSHLVSSVPQSERLTWTKQEEEARAWLNDNNVSTPLIDGILSQRTKYTKQELIEKIIAKADAYATAIGTLTGIRQAQEDLLDE